MHGTILWLTTSLGTTSILSTFASQPQWNWHTHTDKEVHYHIECGKGGWILEPIKLVIHCFQIDKMFWPKLSLSQLYRTEDTLKNSPLGHTHRPHPPLPLPPTQLTTPTWRSAPSLQAQQTGPPCPLERQTCSRSQCGRGSSRTRLPASLQSEEKHPSPLMQGRPGHGSSASEQKWEHNHCDHEGKLQHEISHPFIIICYASEHLALLSPIWNRPGGLLPYTPLTWSHINHKGCCLGTTSFTCAWEQWYLGSK